MGNYYKHWASWFLNTLHLNVTKQEERVDKEKTFLSTPVHMELLKQFKFYKLTTLNW